MNESARAVIGYPRGKDGAVLSARDTGFVPQGKFIMFSCLSYIINPLLTKLVRSRWLDIGLVLFLRVSSHLDHTLGQ